MRIKAILLLAIMIMLVLPTLVPKGAATQGSAHTRTLHLQVTPPPSNRTILTLQGPSVGPTRNLTISGSSATYAWVDPTTGGGLAGSVTVNGNFTVVLWLRSNSSNMRNANVTVGLYTQFFLGTPGLVQASTKQVLLDSSDQSTNFQIPAHFLFAQSSSILLKINATSTSNTKVFLLYGSQPRDSSLSLPIISYVVVSNIQIFDANGTARKTFYVNWTEGNNLVHIIASVQDSFGFSDIAYVNVTIVGPNQLPVAGYANYNMTESTASGGLPQWEAIFLFDKRSSLGTYSVNIGVVDQDGNVVQGTGSLLYTFGLDKTPPLSQLPTPQQVLPYALAAIVGAAVLGGVYFQKRKKRDYFAPFEYLYTLTGGDFPQGTMVTIQGNTGSGKTLLSEQLMYDDLRNGKPCVFVATADFPGKIRTGMDSMGFKTQPYEEKQLLTFIDCYSAEAGQPSGEKFYVSSTSDLTSLGVKISSALPEPSTGSSLFFDSLTPLTPRAKPESIISFAQSVGAKIRGIHGKVFFTLGASIDEMVRKQLDEISDCVIQMEAFEENGLRRRRMRVMKFRNRRFVEGWVAFTVEEGRGIIFYTKSKTK